MKKKTLFVVASSLLLVSCGGTPEGSSAAPASQTPSGDPSSSQQTVVKYTVKFANTTMPDVQVEAGQSLSKPSDPSKDGHLFVGWYKEAAFENEVSFPLVINADTTIYASFYSYGEAFKKARANTIGATSPGYEYDYSLDVSATYMAVNLAGNAIGNAKYIADSTDVSFYDEHVNSGVLFYDGSKYQIKKGRELHEISLDKMENVKKYTIKEVGEDYTYDSSSFAKAVFDYSDDKLKSITPTSTKNEYKLDVGFHPSAAIALVGNYVNHPIVEALIGQLPDTSVSTAMYVTFAGNKLNTYRYVMGIDVSGIKFDLTYALTFKNQGTAPTITPKVFQGTYVSDADVATQKADVDGVISAYKSLAHSSYEFTAKTAVDFPSKNAIDATVKGFAKRQVDGNEVYFLNDYEIDSDLKNADLYKEAGLKDAHGGRVKLSTGEVHDLKKKLLGGYSDVGVVENYVPATDDYYLMDVMGMFNKISFIQKTANAEKGTVTFGLGTTDEGAASVLNAFNLLLRLNPLGESDVDVKAFGVFDVSSVEVKDFAFQLTLLNGAFSEIHLKMNGGFATSYPGSRDFVTSSDASFKLEYDLKVTADGASYEPSATVDKVK